MKSGISFFPWVLKIIFQHDALLLLFLVLIIVVLRKGHDPLCISRAENWGCGGNCLKKKWKSIYFIHLFFYDSADVFQGYETVGDPGGILTFHSVVVSSMLCPISTWNQQKSTAGNQPPQGNGSTERYGDDKHPDTALCVCKVIVQAEWLLASLDWVPQGKFGKTLRKLLRRNVVRSCWMLMELGAVCVCVCVWLCVCLFKKDASKHTHTWVFNIL